MFYFNNFILYLNSGERVVIVRISGGLGNQMFQYAVAKSLSKNKKDEFSVIIKNTLKSKNQNSVYYFKNELKRKFTNIQDMIQ